MSSSEEVFETMEAEDWDKSKDMISSVSWTPADLEKNHGFRKETLLIRAAREGMEDVVCLLLDIGAAIEATDEDGCTALYFAARNGNLRAVEILLDLGADIDARETYKGDTPLIAAANYDRSEVVALLVNRGANVNAQNYYQNTVLHFAAEEGHLRTIEILLDRGADIHARNRDEETALYWAAQEGHHRAVEILLDRGADIEAREKVYGFTPLIKAAYFERYEVVALLLNRGANINAQDNIGGTALTRSIGGDQVAMVKLLCSKGADLNIKDMDDRNALDHTGYRCSISRWRAKNAIIAAILEEAEWRRVKNFVVCLHTGGLSSADWSVRGMGGGGSMPTMGGPTTTAYLHNIPSSGFTGRSRKRKVLENRDLCRIVSCYIPSYLDRL